MKKNLNITSFVIIFCSIAFSQSRDVELGAVAGSRSGQGAFFNFSDPESINMTVSVWGWVKIPGRYKVPVYTTVSDLISYTGGPLDGADLKDLRISRINEDGSESLIKFSCDIIDQEKPLLKNLKSPKLEGGDILLVPGEPKMYFKEEFSLWMSIIGLLTSITILILNITNK